MSKKMRKLAAQMLNFPTPERSLLGHGKSVVAEFNKIIHCLEYG